MKTSVVCAVMLCGLSMSVAAREIDRLDDLSQRQFKALSQDLAAVAGYKAVASAKPQGVVGFDVGVNLTATQVDSAAAWRVATGGEDVDTVAVPKIYVRKGLPLDIDVGAYYVSVPGSNIEAWGGELQYALLDGGLAAPALAVRGTYTGIFGVDDLDFTTTSLELAVSKSFVLVTPYAGIGRQWTVSTPQGLAADIGLDEENFADMKYFAGVVFSPAMFNLSVEYDVTGDVPSASVKLGLKF